MKSPPLSASRMAEVAAATISSTLWESARRRNLARVWRAAVVAVGGQAPAVEAAGPQTDHFLFPVNDFEGQVGPHLHHDHVDRIGADVDRGDAHVGAGERTAGLAEDLLVTSTLYTARSVEPGRILP